MWPRFTHLVLFCAILRFNFTQSYPADEPKSVDFIDLRQYGRKLFGKPDYTTGEKLANYNPEVDSVNPEELGSYLEGDILMPLIQGRNGLTATSSHWPNATVYYKIDGTFNTDQTNMIIKAFNEISTQTCIKFRPKGSQTSVIDYISIVNGNTGCWSSVGRIGGKQEMNLQTPGCMVKIGTVIHELLHVLGFFHQHSSQARDSWIDIIWANVRAGLEHNFNKITQSSSSFLEAYDYDSVMHYSPNAFSINGQRTIEAKPPSAQSSKMGQRDGMSASDIKKIKAMYKC